MDASQEITPLEKKQIYQVSADIPDELLHQYLAQKDIAVDTELHGLELFRDQVCLVQLCDREGRVCLVRPQPGNLPPNLKRLLTDESLLKVFHYALGDVAFLKVSNGVDVHPYHCTKVMSKLVRTYARSHGLQNLTQEILGNTVDKAAQSSDWSQQELSPEQLQYAANDVLSLLPIYDHLLKMMESRKHYGTGCPINELNERCQAFIPTLVALVINGFSLPEDKFKTGVFDH